MIFSPYAVNVSEHFDGYIDQYGRYYIVKEKGSSEELHNLWAKDFLKKYSSVFKVDVNLDYNIISNIKKLNNYEDILINIFGFISYKHDSKYFEPVVKLPNPEIAGQKASKDQIEALYIIMDINDEDPVTKDFMIDANIFYYNGLEEGGYIKK